MTLLKGWEKETFLMEEGKPVKLKTGTAKRRKGCGRKPVYGSEVIASLRIIWAFFEAWPPFHITAEVKATLLTISPRTRFRGRDH
jgi:hypothetical protein